VPKVLVFEPRTRARRQRAVGRLRAFTLIELIVVVVIIAVIAVLAIPSITLRMRDRRTQQAAQMVASLYTDARMRAMGRGSAVLVRYANTKVASGELDVREAIRGESVALNDPDCEQLPVSTCLPPTSMWELTADKTNRILSTYNPSIRAEYADVQIEMEGPDGQGVLNELDVCFTPMGRAFYRAGPSAQFQTLSGVPVANVWRKGGDGKAIGLERLVMVLPNGNARLGTSRVKP
jgi:prepilin-type N-terminal cleavage/methylation domain-containing protein